MNYTGIPTSSGTGGYDSGIAPASRIHSSLHHPALMRMLTLPINWDLIGKHLYGMLGPPLRYRLRHTDQLTSADYIVDCVVEIVNNASVKSTLSGFTSTRPLKNAYFVNFVQNVLTKSRVGMSTLLVTLSYIDRVRSKLVITHREWACERVFLGALILARKVWLLVVCALHDTYYDLYLPSIPSTGRSRSKNGPLVQVSSTCATSTGLNANFCSL